MPPMPSYGVGKDEMMYPPAPPNDAATAAAPFIKT